MHRSADAGIVAHAYGRVMQTTERTAGWTRPAFWIWTAAGVLSLFLAWMWFGLSFLEEMTEHCKALSAQTSMEGWGAFLGLPPLLLAHAIGLLILDRARLVDIARSRGVRRRVHRGARLRSGRAVGAVVLVRSALHDGRFGGELRTVIRDEPNAVACSRSGARGRYGDGMRQWGKYRAARLRLAVTAAVTAVFALGGCASTVGAVDEPANAAEAKQTTQQTERNILGLLPPGAASDLQQADEGTLMNCGERRALWAGAATVAVDESADYAQLLDVIAAGYKSSTVFEIDREPSAAGEPSVQFVHANGESYLIGPRREERRLEVLSFSPCFDLSEGQRAGTSF